MTKKILIIEDVELNRDLLVQLLEDDYEVSTASDGAEGLEAARRDHPDVVLMDLQLPVLDGWETTRRIKSDPELRDVIVIAVSSHAMPGDEQRARDSGCDDYMSKPVDESLRFEKLEAYLGGERP